MACAASRRACSGHFRHFRPRVRHTPLEGATGEKPGSGRFALAQPQYNAPGPNRAQSQKNKSIEGNHKMAVALTKKLLLTLALAAAAQAALAANCAPDFRGAVNCPGNSACMMTRSGEVRCARDGGGIALDREGDARCGVGRCAVDMKGNVMCSSTAGGGASLDSSGAVVCDAGCRPGSGTACSAPR